MESLSINTKKLISAAANAGIEHTEIVGLDPAAANTTVKLAELAPPILSALLRNGRLGAAAKQAIRKLLGDRVSDAEFDEPQTSLIKFSNILIRLQDDSEPTLEFTLAGKSYPIFLTACQLEQGFIGKYLYTNMTIAMMPDGMENITKSVSLGENTLSEMGGATVRSILSSSGMRPIQEETLTRWKTSRLECIRLSKDEMGAQYVCTGQAIKTSATWWDPTVVLPLGYIGRVVIEPDMESNPRSARHSEQSVGYKHLPLVRCFSLDTKEYVYIDVENLKKYEYDEKANERLVLPDNMKSILTSLFNWNGSEGFGDIFNDRHGGVIVLAAGKPGVGKTLTAEVYAHTMKRPLYSIDLTELGTNVAQVESSLNTIFQRVTRWNAVLLLDEADIFMAERTKEELERSAIVGVFLRVLDRYRGTLFLTTNRTEVLDPAFASRITVRLDYPDLDSNRRQKIWELMLAKAKILPLGDISALSAIDLNGREIRNCVRLVRIIHPTSGELPPAELEKIAMINARKP